MCVRGVLCVGPSVTVAESLALAQLLELIGMVILDLSICAMNSDMTGTLFLGYIIPPRHAYYAPSPLYFMQVLIVTPRARSR